MFNKLISITIFGAFLLSACSSVIGLPDKTPEPKKGSLPTLSGEWTINMTHSGGIMGLMRSIEVTSTGSYTVKDERGKTNITGQLSQADFANLIQVVNSTAYSQNQKPYGCADCFIYDITITSDDGIFFTRVDDISIEESGLSTLVASLRNIIEQELK